MGKKALGAAEDPTAKLLDTAIAEFLPKLESGGYYGRSIDEIPSGKLILKLGRPAQAKLITYALDRIEDLERMITLHRSAHTGALVYNLSPNWKPIWDPRWVLKEVLRALLHWKLPLTETVVARILSWPLTSSSNLNAENYPWPVIAETAERFAESNQLGFELQASIAAISEKLRTVQYEPSAKTIADRFQSLISGPQVRLEAGEAWSDVALADLGTSDKAKPLHQLLIHCQLGGQGKFTDKWAKDTQRMIAEIGPNIFKECILRWFPLVDKPRTQYRERQHASEPHFENLIIPPHVELLRGLVWCCGLREDADLARAIAKLALSAYRKIPGKGPRLVSLGNACITSLGMMPGLSPIGQLAILKVKVKFGTAQKEIEKAFNAAAARENLPRDEIEEMAVPSYGLEDVGVLHASFGDYRAELLVDGSTAALQWSKDGKPIKSVPGVVKQEHGEEFKELQASQKDINTMLPAQRERLDALFLTQKTWPIGIWRERYLDHPLVGTMARRLIWSFTAKGEIHDGIWHAGQVVGVNGKPLSLRDDTTVALWHPIGRSVDEVLAWRASLERHEVVQPFKQAHREVYVLTDAERNTGTYSNRFAAHVLKQHQFNALCAARGWKNKLRLMVDDSYPPAHRTLTQWNLRAEYWIEGAGTEYGTDTNEAGTFLYLTTDQVRFYRLAAPQMHAHASGGGYGRYNQTDDDPLPLTEVPPLVFSEIMRDVDLFVGVASVGNDPNWNDGGPGGRHRDYWTHFAFGELGATAQTRKVLLERLVPRLKIASRCSLAERFLIVKGDIRTYKIHLGSGNILMEPNDQYLCIVPKQTTATNEGVFLPFEGDATLSVILSKAFLLAEDTKIKDPTIVSQLKK